MPTAILIGFEYKFNALTGAIIDLYNAQKWCESFGCDTFIFTDISFIKDLDNLKNVVERKIAEPDLLQFYDKIISKTIVNNGTTLLMGIIQILKLGIPDRKLVIYYSGHGVKDSMVMPDRTLLPFIDFRDNILDILDPYVEIFWILDCCNPNGLHLPYKLEGNNFVLSPSKIEFFSQPILLITSSEAYEKSIATKSGSVFSRHLFRLLTLLNNETDQLIFRKRSIVIPTHKNRNLRRLIGNLASSIRKMHTGYAQTVSIYSSYMIDPVLWMWVGSNKKYDIVSDITLSTLIIRNHDNFIIKQPKSHVLKSRQDEFSNNTNIRSGQLVSHYSNTTRDSTSKTNKLLVPNSIMNIGYHEDMRISFASSESTENIPVSDSSSLSQITNPYDLLYPEY